MTEVTSAYVQLKHIRQANLCMGGARKWFASHDIAWSRVMAGEVQASELEATGDKMALDVAAIARADHG